MKYEVLLRETNASKINSKFCQKKKKKKGRNHVNIINKYFLPCFHFLIRESCPFFSPLFSFYYYFLFVCFFLSLFFLISINYLFFLSVKKNLYIPIEVVAWLRKTLFVSAFMVYNRISIYGVLISCMCTLPASTLTPNGYIFATNLISFI